MIQKIKLRFIALAMAALLLLLAAIVTGMNIINYNTIVNESDVILEVLAQNAGVFPEHFSPKKRTFPYPITLETPYESRYFSILVSIDGEILNADMRQIKAVTIEDAAYYADLALQSRFDQDFIENYRFHRAKEGNIIRLTFLDCGRKLDSYHSFLISSILMAVAGYISFFFVILFFSEKLLKPVTESYEKQKQFITDAGHEIKTPLAIIQADVDVLEMEHGSNEWLDGIRSQITRLTSLTSDLIYLSRMEEADTSMPMIEFPFSDVVSETAMAFQGLAQTQNKTFLCNVPSMISYEGNEKSIRQLVNILMDNALKYSPEGGTISLTVQRQGKQIKLSVYNTTEEPIDKGSIKHLFDRFYRADSSRSQSKGGYGIGLSVAKAIMQAHNGKISAITKDGTSLEITAVFF